MRDRFKQITRSIAYMALGQIDVSMGRKLVVLKLVVLIILMMLFIQSWVT